MGRYPEHRRQSDLRVTVVTGAIHRALVTCISAEPALTEEELLTALLDVAARKTQRLRTGQVTPSVAGTARGDVVPSEWVTAFDQAVAAIGCPRCGRSTQCRCLVADSERPSRTAIGLAAVLPLIAATVKEDRADAHR